MRHEMEKSRCSGPFFFHFAFSPFLSAAALLGTVAAVAGPKFRRPR